MVRENDAIDADRPAPFGVLGPAQPLDHQGMRPGLAQRLQVVTGETRFHLPVHERRLGIDVTAVARTGVIGQLREAMPRLAQGPRRMHGRIQHTAQGGAERNGEAVAQSRSRLPFTATSTVNTSVV